MSRQYLRRMFFNLGLGAVAATLLAAPSFAADAYLAAKEFAKTMPDGVAVTMWGFAEDLDGNLATDGGEAPTSPGPMITVQPGDNALNIHVRNDLTVPISIVIPGQVAQLSPVKFTDATGRLRAQSMTNEVAPGSTGVYSWNNLRPGTYIYHSGTHPSVQVPMGLYGGVKKDAQANTAYSGNPRVDASYDREVVLFYSEVDPALNTAVATGTYGTAAYPGTIHYSPRYFLVNGSPWTPATRPIQAFVNERVLVRLLNAGLESHSPLLGGLYGKLIAEDGNLYPYAKDVYTAMLPPGRTKDMIIVPASEGVYPVFDRRLFVFNSEASAGGMLSHLQVASSAGAPTAVDDAYATDEDTPLAVALPGVLANDSDPNGDPITAALVSTTSAGVLALNADGSFTYTPGANFNGSDLFEYRASDGTLSSNVARVQITVNPVNDAPVAAADSAATEEAVAVAINVLANDSDADGTALTVGALTQPANGTAVINQDNTVTYTSYTGFTGVDSFTYTASDGVAQSPPATVTVTVVARVNEQPIAVDDYATTPKNSPVVINLVANDSDPDGTVVPGSVAIVVQPTRGGTVINNGDGTVTFTPKRNFRGTDTFTYTVNDNDGATSNEATVRVNVVR